MKTIKIVLTASIFLTIAMIACDKKDALITRGETMEGGGIKAMNLSQDAPNFNIMVDSIRTITVLSTTGLESGLVFGNVFPSLAGGYAKVPAGSHTISAKVASTSTTLPNQTIVSKNVTIENGKFYTVAIIDSLSRLDAVIVEDNLNVPDTSKAYFRIANFMLGGTADVEFTGTAGGYNFSKNGVAYKNVSAFDTLTPATYKILLRANGSSARLDSITAFAPLKGRKYTLYTRGVVGLPSTNAKRALIFSMTNY